jgi:DNA mismatch repair protein MutS2
MPSNARAPDNTRSTAHNPWGLTPEDFARDSDFDDGAAGAFKRPAEAFAESATGSDESQGQGDLFTGYAESDAPEPDAWASSEPGGEAEHLAGSYTPAEPPAFTYTTEFEALVPATDAGVDDPLCPASTTTQRALDFDAVLQALAAEARSPRGKERFAVARFPATLEAVNAELDHTGEAALLLERGPAPDLALEDLRPVFARLKKDGVLLSEDFLALRRFLAALERVVDGFDQQAGAVTIPRLKAISALIDPQYAFHATLEKTFDDEGHILDGATPRLYEARTEARREQARLQRRVQELLRTFTDKGWLQDSFYTLRNDRYVLPVKAAYRYQFAGIVHDASQTGQTVFIEPEELIESGNRLMLALSRVRDEERRILIGLSHDARAREEPFEQAAAACGRLDEILARGRLAHKLSATRPVFGPVLNFERLRHPLLALVASEVVPNDLLLAPRGGSAAGTGVGLIVTGPNAGGKSVFLKSVGLAVLMARLGAFVPVGIGSTMPFVGKVLASFGDAQSIERHLSSFTGQVARLSEILDEARTPRGATLALLDEIGTDTDPREGAALAAAFIEELVNLGATVLATTHYPELRALALDHPQFVNAAVGIDPATLRPTYRLQLGLSGQSFAFEAARRAGLDEAILKRAEELVGERDLRLAQLEQKLVAAESESRLKTELLARREVEMAEAEARLRERTARVEEKEREILAAGRRKTLGELGDLRARIHAIVDDLKQIAVPEKLVTDDDRQKLAHALERAQSHDAALKSLQGDVGGLVDEHDRAAYEQAVDEGRAADPHSLAPGQTVSLPMLRTTGTVESVDRRKGKLIVSVQGKRLEVRVQDVRRPGDEQTKPATDKATRKPLRDAMTTPADHTPASLELNLRGLRLEEAMDRLVSFIDEATRAGVGQARIIHGHGTGALKRAVREHVGRVGEVKRSHPAPPEEGGDGATIVYFE